MKDLCIENDTFCIIFDTRCIKIRLKPAPVDFKAIL